MLKKLATTKNTIAMLAGMEKLKESINGKVRMGLFYGPPGVGKTESFHDYAFRNESPYIRATTVDSPSSLLRALVMELGEEPSSRVARRLFDQAVSKMMEINKPVIIDETDYLVGHRNKFIELLRDLNDVANVPVVMVGMEHIDKKLAPFPHLFDRIAVKVKLELFNADDIKSIAGDICETGLDETAVEYITQASGGKLRKITELFSLAERIDKHNKVKTVTAEHLKSAEQRRARR